MLTRSVVFKFVSACRIAESHLSTGAGRRLLTHNYSRAISVTMATMLHFFTLLVFRSGRKNFQNFPSTVSQ